MQRYFVLYCIVFYAITAASCSAAKITTSSKGNYINSGAQTFINSKELSTAHIGIAVFDVKAEKYLYTYQSDKYFIPASNTKIATCFAAMKYLGDSLEGIKVYNNNGNVYILPTGDPTFLHPDFPNQPVLDYLKNPAITSITFIDTAWNEIPLGNGWSWDDYNDDYMIERSSMPVYGNLFTITGADEKINIVPKPAAPFTLTISGAKNGMLAEITRAQASNNFTATFGGAATHTYHIPFVTENGDYNRLALADTLHKNVLKQEDFVPFLPGDKNVFVIHSQPTDSMLKIMMHRSDNLYAEQSLLMVSNTLLHTMNDAKIIDSLLHSDYQNLPQPPRWVDGSGLSRYNLFTPQDFITILNKMHDTFSWQRITNIFSSSSNALLAGKMFAKTGSMSNVNALSGFLITNKGRLLTFSILINNHMTTGAHARQLMDAFLEKIIED